MHDARPFGAPTCALGFDETFEAYYPLMVRALTADGGDAEVAADATQEAFLHAHLRWRVISRYEDPVGWVRRVAINRIRDHFRRETRGAKALVALAAEPQWIDARRRPTTRAALLAGAPPAAHRDVAVLHRRVVGRGGCERHVAVDGRGQVPPEPRARAASADVGGGV